MKKFLETIGLVTIVDVPDAAAPPKQPVPAPSPVAFTPSPLPVASSTFVPSTAVPPEMAAKLQELDNSAKERIKHVLDNDGAPLCEELAETLEALAESIPDQTACYRAALKLMAKKGHTKDLVLADYSRCLQALADNATAFDAETTEAVQRKVGTRHQTVANIDAKVQALQASIASIQQEIQTLTQTRATEVASISDEERKIGLVRERFTNIYNHVRQEITNQQRKVAESTV